MERKARWVCLISAVIIGIFAAVFALSEREEAFSVRTAQAKTQDIYNSVTVFGSVVPSRTVSLVPENSSVVTEVFVREGDTVEKGQPLCTLKAAEAPPLSAADVQAAVSAVQADRMKPRPCPETRSPRPFPAQSSVCRALVRPVRGGFPCAVIADLSSLRVRAETPELYADELRAGQKANITLASADRMYAARVASLAPVAVQAVSLAGDSGSVTVETMLDLEGDMTGLRPGSSATVKIFTDHRKNAVVVPYEAVCQRGEQEYVFTIENGRAVQNPVVTGYLLERVIEVRSGLEGGETVILSPSDELENGAKLEVQP